jgi:hypothetical protein
MSGREAAGPRISCMSLRRRSLIADRIGCGDDRVAQLLQPGAARLDRGLARLRTARSASMRPSRRLAALIRWPDNWMASFRRVEKVGVK